MFNICSPLYFLFLFTFLCQFSKFTADKMSARLLLAVFRLEMTTSLAAAGDFACPPPTRPRRPKPLPLACTCAARSPVVRPPLAPALRRASVPAVRRDRSLGRPRPAKRSCWSVFFYRLFERLFKTVLGRLRLADVDDISSGTMDVKNFLRSSLATGTTYFFTSGKATRPIRIANAPIPPPDPNCRAGPP